ncbi:phosphoribosylaminoimidazolesuccinocarboxamide synthase [Candidatus Woesearchaeota archaeon]|nr:phosphoribosylaminoimidazolesuccinocarboxamide synthase [Candidatus Woesearchaeota archaeon]|tara:strand:+ start:27647 stop:28618 length:972 start_codon:yes stop_codon:yes gene_type:complete
MISDEIIKNNINNTVKETDFSGLGEKYKGKVRDNYTDKENGKRVIVVTDRISAFDVVLGTIPFKGQVLNQLAAFWFNETKDVAPSHFIENPDPNVMIVKLCKTFPVEVIVRNYITGSLWREYEKGEDNYGLGLPSGMKKDQKFDQLIITPSTKADEGHDLPMKREDVLKLIPEEKYAKMEETALKLFARGSEIAAKRGLILVDTKYEFGESSDGEILVIDEIHTPDSSRYWIKESYDELFGKKQSQKMLDKEYIRQWLINEKGYMGNGPAPQLSEEVIVTAAKKYIELYELITGEKFEVVEGNVDSRIRKNLLNKGLKVEENG